MYDRVEVNDSYYDGRGFRTERNEATVWTYDHIKELSRLTASLFYESLPFLVNNFETGQDFETYLVFWTYVFYQIHRPDHGR